MGIPPEGFDQGRLSLGDEFDGYLENKEPREDLDISIGDSDGKLYVKFNKSIKWFGMEPKDAVMLAQTMIQRAIDIANKEKKGFD